MIERNGEEMAIPADAWCVFMMTCQVLDYVAQKAEVYELQEALRNWRKKARLTIYTHK